MFRRLLVKCLEEEVILVKQDTTTQKEPLDPYL